MTPELVADALGAVRSAPAADAAARFEALAWEALLRSAGAPALTRAHAPFHLTASAIVLSPDAASTCLVLHGKIGQWVQPGGHLEPGDTSVAEAAAREVREETGLGGRVGAAPLLLSRHPAPCAPGVVDWHLDVQHLIVAEPAPPQVSAESEHVAWWPVDALPEPLCDGVAELVRLGVAALRGAPAPA